MKKKSNNYLLLVVLILLMIIMYVFFIAQSYDSTPYFAKKGILKLTNSDLKKHGIIEANGKWKFYKNTLKSEITSKTSFLFKEVPDFWEEDANMKNSPYGVGTYKLKINGLKPRQRYGVEILDEVTAYNLYCNNKLIMSNGVINKNRRRYVPKWHSSAMIFQADKNGKAEIVMEIENYEYYRGGFWNSLKIGSVQKIFEDINKSKAREMFLFTFVFTVGIFALLMLILGKRDKTILYFGLFCFSVCLQTISTGQRVILESFPDLDWHILNGMQFLFGYLIIPSLGMFVINLFELQEHVILRRIIYVFFAGCIFGTFILPNEFCYNYIEINKWAVVFIGIYFIYLVITKYDKKKHQKELMLFAAMIMIVSELQEIFIRGPVSWVPFGMINFVTCFAIITFSKFIKVMKENEILETKVIIDQLTGLCNRRYLKKIDKNYMQPEEDKKKYILFLDLDRFKSINDNFGHKIGDFILKQVSKRLKAALQHDDIICRYGGDEIIVITVVDKNEDITVVCDKIIEVITTPFEKDGMLYEIGVSIGVAQSNEDMYSLSTLTKKSDKAMYSAKKSGGNRYVIYDQIDTDS